MELPHNSLLDAPEEESQGEVVVVVVVGALRALGESLCPGVTPGLKNAAWKRNQAYIHAYA